MASCGERLRRQSYAFAVQPLEQKSRRVSYAGQSSLGETAASKEFLLRSSSRSQAVDHFSPAANPNTSSAMLDGIIVSKMDMNRNLRRTSRATDGEGITCSQQSILSAMDRFVKAVNNMDATVLIPSRLRDMEFESGMLKTKRPPLGLSGTDLYSFYAMLKDVKTELLWGSAMGAASSMLGSLNGRTTPRHHMRQPSDDSLGSTGSDQDTDCSDIDSVLTDRDSCSADEQTSHIAVAFRYHLQGLHAILHQLADSADYLAARYQAEVDAASL